MDLDNFKPFKDYMCLCAFGVSVNNKIKKGDRKVCISSSPSKSLCTTEVKENSRDKYSRSRLTTIMKLWAMSGE